MRRSAADKAFSAVVGLVGALAVFSGLYVVAVGGGAIPGGDGVAPSVDSELRLLAVFWIGFGVAVLRIAPRATAETTAVRAMSLALFVGGVARVISWLAVGRPEFGIQVLTVIELVGPVVLVAWQLALRRSIEDGGSAP